MKQEFNIPADSILSIEQKNNKIIIDIQQIKPQKGDILESKDGNVILIFDCFTQENEFYSIINNNHYNNYDWDYESFKPASEQSKQRLFDYLKSINKQWNSGKLELEDIQPKFKKGDILEYAEDASIVLIFDHYTEEDEFSSVMSNTKLSNTGWIAKLFKPASEKSKQQLFDYLDGKNKQWDPETLEVKDTQQELKPGDLAIFWDDDDKLKACISTYDYTNKSDRYPYYSKYTCWEHAVKFESIEQFKKFLNE